MITLVLTRRLLRRKPAFGLVIVFLSAIPASGQVGSGDKYTPEELHRHFQSVAEAYEISSGGGQLQLRSRPLMHWQNTVRKQEQGALYLWERDGRPQVLGSIFTFEYNDRARVRHEMISVSDTPLTARLDSRNVWTPMQAGVVWKTLPETQSPGKSMPRRLVQMRAIARSFEGKLEIPDRQDSHLTLIPQPLVRYSSPGSNVVDGAIFSLAVVTDPEILLIIEATENETGTLQWRFAAARAHYHKLELKADKQVVWQAPMVIELESTRAGQMPFASQPYFTFFPPKPLPPPEQLRSEEQLP